MQALEALERANVVRIEGAVVRRELSALPRTDAFKRASLTVLNPPPAIQRMRVGHFLRALPGLGPRKVDGLLESVGIDPEWAIGPEASRRVLTHRQRQRLAGALQWRAT